MAAPECAMPAECLYAVLTKAAFPVRRLPSLWLLSNALWPAAHVINFRYVPPEQRVLFVNCVSIIWNVVTCGVVGKMGSTPGRGRLKDHA